MKKILNFTSAKLSFALGLCLFAQTSLHAQGTAFTYQGQLNNGGLPAGGLYDFRFKLYADPLGNTQVGSGYPTNGVPVTNGLFTTTIDFGAGIFTGGTNWLEVDVRTNGAAGYTVLNPLQGITPTPNAIFATTAGNVSGTVPAAQIGGTILNSSLPASPNFSGTVTANQISGNGANVTNVNAALLNGKAATNFWQTGGNVGTSPANGNYLGTTDNQPLELRVNNSRALRIEPNSGTAPNFIFGSPVNFVTPGVVGAVIDGGGATNYSGLAYTNSIAADFGIIAGGAANQIQAGSTNSMIGGGHGNTIQANSQDSFIGVGLSDVIQPNAPGSVIGGGYANIIGINADHSVIGGGYVNALQPSATDSVIGGGNFNLIQSSATGAVIGGGYNNLIATNADHGVIGGGWQNQIQTFAYESVIAGGNLNVVGPGAQWSVIGGGEYNFNNGSYSFIGGGTINTNNGSDSVIAGGYNNLISSNTYQVVIGGGRSNQILPSNYHSVIGGGAFNLIQNFANDSVIGGGYQNAINLSANNGFIGGGYLNTIQPNSPQSFIGGGVNNTAYGDTNNTGLLVIVGGGGNTIFSNAFESAIVGGTNNSIQMGAPYSFIGGGLNNLIIGDSTGYGTKVIAGGYFNYISTNAWNSAIVGGGYNVIGVGGNYAFIGGGTFNTNSGSAGTVGGGYQNTVSGSEATVSGGQQNVASSFYAAIPGGYQNIAAGNFSFAAGQQAQALHQGAFVWADSQTAPFASTAGNQFLIRAGGGVGINTNNPAGAALNVNGKITAPMWKANNIINTPGSLPVSQIFTTSGGTLVISASGTGYSTTAGAVIGMDINLDGTTIDSCLIFANPSLTHMAFLPKTIVRTGVAAGSHSIQLAAHAGTTTDGTDSFCVTVQELPF